MLIRSQSKSAIINIDNLSCVEVRDINGGAVIVIEAFNYSLNIAEYSTKEKALKVLDMIQEAYVENETLKTISAGTLTAMLTKDYNLPSSVDLDGEMLKNHSKIMENQRCFRCQRTVR